MSLTDRIMQIWHASNHTPPMVPLAYHDEDLLLTIEDSGPIWRFLAVDGQVYSAVGAACKIRNPRDANLGPQAYVCTGLTIVMCSPSSGPHGARDMFVLNNIVPLVS